MSWQPPSWQPDGWQPEGWDPAESDVVVVVPDVRFEFRSRRSISVYPAIVSDDGYTFVPAIKDPDESLKVRLNLFNQCANFWQANESYEQGEYTRPNRANGYSQECTTAGTSGSREPNWAQTIGATTRDGSAVWTCRAAGSNGINAITSPSASSDPTGLTISDVSVSEDAKILATYSGGTEGEDYDAVFSFTLNGVPRVARQTVQIRKR